jgi:hypothetical protein
LLSRLLKARAVTYHSTSTNNSNVARACKVVGVVELLKYSVGGRES